MLGIFRWQGGKINIFFLTVNLGCQKALLGAQLKLELSTQRGEAFPARVLETGCQVRLLVLGSSSCQGSN